jgi:signal transduction histidine kinase
MPENDDIVELKTFMNKIIRGSDHLTRMTSQLLDIESIEQGVVHLNLQPCNIAQNAVLMCDLFNVIADGSGNILSLEPPPDLPYVTADSDKITQILFNLIHNANRHTRNGSIKIRIFKEDKFLTVSVKDSGEGIKSDIIPVLFTKNPRGVTEHGLGLYYSSIFVKCMNGRIFLHDTSKNGTDIRFSLPLIYE